MKANELRIGNLVYLKSKDKVYQIGSGHDIEEIDDAPEMFDATPIKLTEEWLEKLGLRCDSVSKWKCAFNEIARVDKLYSNNIWGIDSINNVDIDVIYNADETELRRIGIRGTIAYDIKYVHQLQNLYFALTGTELECVGF